MSKILIVDDEPAILKSLQRLFRAAPCQAEQTAYSLEVTAFESPEEALEDAQINHYDLVIADYRMPGINGVDFLKAMKLLQPDAARLILSGYADLNALIRAINEVGIERFIAKPWNDYELVAAVGQALAKRDLMLENRQLANLVRVEMGDIDPQVAEAERLEALEPGITQVHWGADGSVLLDPEFEPKDD